MRIKFDLLEKHFFKSRYGSAEAVNAEFFTISFQMVEETFKLIRPFPRQDEGQLRSDVALQLRFGDEVFDDLPNAVGVAGCIHDDCHVVSDSCKYFL